MTEISSPQEPRSGDHVVNDRVEQFLWFLASASLILWIVSVALSLSDGWNREDVLEGTTDRAQIVTMSLSIAWGYLLVTTVALVGLLVGKSPRR